MGLDFLEEERKIKLKFLYCPPKSSYLTIILGLKDRKNQLKYLLSSI
jgi:hypothetical protein